MVIRQVNRAGQVAANPGRHEDGDQEEKDIREVDTLRHKLGDDDLDADARRRA